MATTATIPVDVSPGAEAHVAQLGVRREFEIRLEHTKEAVPGLRSIAVTLEDRYDLGDDPMVLISAEVPGPGSVDDRTQTQWDRWVIETFHPDVHQHFCFLTVYGTGADGR